MTADTSTFVPLESGDRLSRDEFHRRYCARPDIKKAELVNGVVYVPSPVRRLHSLPHTHMIQWATTFALRHPHIEALTDVTVRLSAASEVQPDVLIYRLDSGRLALTDDGYLAGAPELVIEIAASSAAYDLHAKKQAYERAGVAEYIVWQVLEQRIDWFRLVDGRYQPVAPGPDGLLESGQFPGLRLNAALMLAGDVAGALKALDS